MEATNEQLIERYRNCQSEAEKKKLKDELILQNIGLVHRVAKSHHIYNVAIEDLVNEGIIGLMQAIENYKPKKAKFATYAWRYVARNMKVYIDKQLNNGCTPIDGTRFIAKGHEPVEKIEVCSLDDVELEFSPDFQNIDSKYYLKRILKSLPEREYFIIDQMFGLSDGDAKTLEAVGQQLGITRERVRQLQKKILAKLRNQIEIGSLKSTQKENPARN